MVEVATERPRMVPMPGLPGGPRRRLGRILLSRGLVNIRQLAHAAALQEARHVDASAPRLAAAGTLGRADSEGLSQANGHVGRSGLGAGPAGERLGTILLRLGYVQPMHLVRALCDQAGVVDFLVFGRYVVEPPLARLIPRPLAHDLAVLPLVRLPQANYLVASGSPLSGLALARLQRRLRGPVEPILVREPDFHRAIDLCYDALQRRGTAPVRLGEILVRDRLVQAGEVARALGEVHRTGRPLGEVLVRRGLLDEGAVYLLLARQRGLRLVSAREVVDPREAAPLVERLPRGYVRHNQVIPYRRTGASVLAVTSDPNLDTTCLAEALSCQRVTLQLAPKSEMAHLVEETCRLAAG